MSAPQKKIGRYIVENLLGEGAMGSVFKAIDPFIKRTVAIKTIKLGQSRNQTDANEFYERFIQEAQISGTLNHPNIVGIFDVGEQDGTPYIAMEYVEGKTLGDVIHGEQQPGMGVRMQIILQIAHALDFAHDHGIVHRDLKPTNIMVMANNTAKIMDFGIAKRSGSNLTQTGVFLGTPSYSSPEQIKEGHVDHRSDIFSFGILAHETMTGHLAFPGQSINAILYKIANEAPTFAPNMRDLPIDLAGWRQVFHKVLDKDASRRYQRASEFAEALSACVKLSQKERAAMGKFMGKFGSAINEAFGVQKNLQRSEFEIAQQTPREDKTVKISKKPAAPKSRGTSWFGILLGVIVLLGATAGGLYYTGNLQPILDWAQELRGGEVAQIEEDPPVLGEKLQKILTIVSEPKGASVRLGDTVLGQTPLSYTWDGVSGDQAAFVFELEGYKGETRPLVLAEALDTAVEMTLTRLPVARTVTSKPAGATVKLNGEKVGETPLDHDFHVGEKVNLRVELAGYLPIRRSYEEGRTRLSQLTFTLKTIPPPGKLNIDSAMNGLQVTVDGSRKRGREHALPEGTYSLQLRAPALFYRQTQKIQIKAGQTLNVSTPVVITIPKIDFIGGFTRVKINGQFIEKDGTPDTTPIVNLRIAAGTYKFEFLDGDDKIVAQKTIEVSRSDSITATADP